MALNLAHLDPIVFDYIKHTKYARSHILTCNCSLPSSFHTKDVAILTVGCHHIYTQKRLHF